MKIISFAGSNSSKSINRKLSAYGASLFENGSVESIDLNDYEMPLFSQDREDEIGKHPVAQQFLDKLQEADILVLSLAENNGNYSAAFKNLFDWCSRIQKEVFQNKPMLLMATSPGARGGKSVLEIAESNLLRYGGKIKAVFSLPSFYENFDLENNVISNPDFDSQLKQIVKDFKING
ncbi:NAD(P)H-dependent oxidoreductase [Flavobacterium sp.]|uniref:NADPH-dependent FMN reductase n=1 Tax=Flavobacterium sp. TaxID=239 RepID=UPI0026188E37|nr:NAD(P)H-dependent oxidoreductase [Flavobacterium sp.]